MTTRMFERDSDQTNVPDGYEAYSLRWWTMVYSGRTAAVSLGANEAPVFDWEGEMYARLPNSLGEISRIMVRVGADIEPALFELRARPIPRSLEECHPRFPERKNLGNSH
jgi:hypothetical protein